MNTEELELLTDSKYRNYVAAVDKALKNFEYSSEWADLISALGKLNKVCLASALKKIEELQKVLVNSPEVQGSSHLILLQIFQQSEPNVGCGQGANKSSTFLRPRVEPFVTKGRSYLHF